MERRARRDDWGRGLAAVLIVGVPILLAGCAEDRPVNEDRSLYSVDTEHAVVPKSTVEQGRYFTVVVHHADSVGEIAERCRLSVATVERLNGIDARTPLHHGEAVRVPMSARAHCIESREARAARDEDVAVIERPLPPPHRDAALQREPSVMPEPRPDRSETAAAPPPPTDTSTSESWSSWWSKPSDESPPAAASPATASGKFIWPVQGRVIEPFGPSNKGERNDGINIATTEGAPIHAADAGTVTYAGNELKGYGNLVLIKHSNGYITAYAHAQSIRVARGDVVEKGQVIGTAGTTGDVTSPQLHFEIRRGVQPVDPMRLLSAERSS